MPSKYTIKSLIPVLVFLVIVATPPLQHAEGIKFWVFFSDKGPVQLNRQLLQNSPIALDERAIARRQKVRSDGALYDFRDLPLYEPYLRRLREMGAAPLVHSRWLNAVSVRLRNNQRGAIMALPFVLEMRPVARAEMPPVPTITALDKVSPDKAAYALDYGASLTQNALINVPQVHELGINGTDVRIGMLDTGFKHDIHEAFRSTKIIAEYDFIYQDSVTSNEPNDVYLGQQNHGTNTLSVIGGFKEGYLIGTAFGAEFMLAKTELEPWPPDYPIEEDYWVAGLEWFEANGVDVVSSSLGHNDWYEYKDMDGETAVTTIAAEIAVQKGVVVVNAMGNEGDDPWRHMLAPADGKSVISVGAVSASNTLVYFSSVGPTFDGRIKPDVVAMGSGVYIAGPYDTTSYRYSSGTSFSCPQVAGIAALVLSAHPNLTPSEVRDALRNTADNAASPNNEIGWGLVNAWDAVLYHGPAFSNRPKVVLTQAGDYEISISVAGDPAVDPGEVYLYWSNDSGNINITQNMASTGNNYTYKTTIPSQPAGTQIYCYFSAKNTEEMMFFHPIDPEENTAFYYFEAGNTTVYYSHQPHMSISLPGSSIPENFTLYPVYPNPFSSAENFVQIKLDLPEARRVTLHVYNVLGQTVATLVDGETLPAKTHYFYWHGRDKSGMRMPSGLYFFRLETPDFVKVQKIVKTK